jgi:electron-transferring-flavoprotein dehydrogenase
VCADAVFDALNQFEPPAVLDAYPQALKASWLWRELYKVRNIRPAFRFGLWLGLAYAAIDTYVLCGRAPWTFGHRPDHLHWNRASKPRVIDYPKPDGVLTFDRLSSVYLANIAHDENQPCHLQLKNPDAPVAVNLVLYDGPEARYCPAGVYEFVAAPDNGLDNGLDGGLGAGPEGRPRLHINAANCIHCKTCDIIDPTQNILWTPPEGASGPNYSNM